MVRKGPWKQVSRDEAAGRLRNARDYMQSAEAVLDLTDAGGNGSPAMAHALLAVIGYADALTMHFGGIQNTRDHAQVIPAIRRVLGTAADAKEMTGLARLLSRKNEIQYDHRASSRVEAQSYLEQCRRFASWAELTLAGN